MPEQMPEPWLRGPLRGRIHPLVMPVLFSFQQVREDLQTYTGDLTDEQVWKRAGNLPTVGFHLRHIAGSVDRLVTYLMGEQLSEEQLRSLREESVPGASIQDLLQAVDASLAAAELRLKTIDPQQIYDERLVGRKGLPTTVIGLLVHLAEHTQRHLGQAITTAKLVRHLP